MSQHHRIIWAVLIAGFALGACRPSPQTGATIPAPVSPSPTVDPGPSPTPEPRPSPTKANFPPLPDPDIPGVIVWGADKINRGLWRITPGGGQTQLLDRPDTLNGADLSPDGTRLLFAGRDRDEDIYLFDLATGELTNVTNTPDRRESYPRWWPGHPDRFLCASWAEGENGLAIGYLTSMGFDGSFEVLDPRGPVELAYAVSPDGERVAYGVTSAAGKPFDLPSGPWIYHPGEDVSSVDALSGLSSGRLSADDFSWSPDGRQLGLALFDVDAQETVVVVVTLENQQVEVLRRYPARETELPGWQNAPRWSPDGKSIMFYSAVGGGGPDPSLWLSDADGVRPIEATRSTSGQDRPYGVVGAPVFSPDGRWVAARISPGGMIFMRVGEWEPLPWNMPGTWRWVGWAD